MEPSRSNWPHRILLLAILLGVTGRVALIELSPRWGYFPDHDDKVRWGKLIVEKGLNSLYTTEAPRVTFIQYHADGTEYRGQRTLDRVYLYPPGLAYALGLQGYVHAQLDPERFSNTRVSRWVYSAGSILADLLMALATMAIYRSHVRQKGPLTERHRLISALLFAAAYLAPTPAIDGAFWSQYDGWLMAAVMAMLWAMCSRRWWLAGIFWGLALGIKPQGMFLAPVWIYALVAYRPRRPILLGLAVTVATINLLALPHWLASGNAWIKQSYLLHLGKMNWGSTVGAYNFWMLEGLWHDDFKAEGAIGPISRQHLGQMLFGVFVLLSYFIAWRRWRGTGFGLTVGAGLMLLAFAFFPTGVHGRYIIYCTPLLLAIAAAVPRLWLPALVIALGGGLQMTNDLWKAAPQRPGVVALADGTTQPATTTQAAELARLGREAQEHYRQQLATHEELTHDREWSLALVMSTAALACFVILLLHHPRSTPGVITDPPVDQLNELPQLDQPLSVTEFEALLSRPPPRASIKPYLLLASLLVLIKVLVAVTGIYSAENHELDRKNYERNYHHHRVVGRYLDPPRYDFFELWGYSDAQWYLAIAEDGYPSTEEFDQQPGHPALKLIDEVDTQNKYAFFPLWPMCIWFGRLFYYDVNAVSYVLANLFSLAAGLLLFGFLRREADQQVAFWTVLLLQASPFGLFYHVPFTESLFLLLAVGTTICCSQRRWLFAGLLLGLTLLSRGAALGVILLPPTYFFWHLWQNPEWRWRELSRFSGLLIAVVPVACWLALNEYLTGDKFYFTQAHGWWGYNAGDIWHNLSANTWEKALEFSRLNWHAFHSSQLDFIVMGVALVLLIIGARMLPLPFTTYAAGMLLVPLLTKDLMSYSRYTVVAWPLFCTMTVMIREDRRNWVLGLTVLLFLAGQLSNTYRLVNWIWVA